jgi:hypothetical protein
MLLAPPPTMEAPRPVVGLSAMAAMGLAKLPSRRARPSRTSRLGTERPLTPMARPTLASSDSARLKCDLRDMLESLKSRERKFFRSISNSVWMTLGTPPHFGRRVSGRVWAIRAIQSHVSPGCCGGCPLGQVAGRYRWYDLLLAPTSPA